MSDETIGQVNSVKVDRWGTGDRNDCYWNIAANQLGEGASAQEIQALCEQLQQYNKEKNTAIQNQGELLMDGDQVFIPLEYAIDEIQTNITAKQEEVTTAQENLSTAQSDLSDANGAVTSTLEAYQSAASAYNGAAEDADNKDGLKAAMDAAKQEYLNAVKAQQAAQEAVETAKGEVETKKTELEAYGTQLEELKTELSEEEENYQEQLNQLDEQIANIDANIQETETSIQQAEAQQQAAAQQQEDAANLGVTEDADGNLTLDDSEITDEQLSGALQSSKDITALADYTNKEVSSQEISEDGNTKTVEFADGTSVKYTKNEETGEWEAMPTTVYDEDGDEIVASEAGETQDEDAGSDEEDINAESSKEEILSHLDENAPDDIEFEQQEDGTYTAEYITSESVSGPETRTKSVVEYDPETGVTTVRRYDVTNNENDEIQEDQEPSSITEYNENTNTETFTYTSTRYRTGEDPETVEEVYTTVYADDSMSDEAITRISKEENGNLTLVTTKENGEQTGKYEIEYGDNNEISSVSITGENGMQTTINASDMKDADGNALSQDKIAKIFADINSGDSPKTAFLQNGADEVYETVKNANVKLADGSTSNEVEEFTNGIDELKGVCVPGVSDFQAAGSLEYDEETGIYSMNYTGTRALGTGSSTEEVKYNVTYDPETGITKFEELDSEGEATGDYSEFNSNTMTKTAQYGNAKEITTCKYDENNELKGLGTTRAEYDENNELTNVTVTDVNGRAKTITATELKSLGVGATEVEDVFAKIEAGEFSPEYILTETFPDLLSDLELSGDLLDDRIPEDYTESGGNIEPSKFLEEWETHAADGTLHDYLIENLDSSNVGELLEYLQSEEQLNGNFTFSDYYSQMNASGMESKAEIGEYLASILATADVENMTESQYDAYIKTISNEMQRYGSNYMETMPAQYLLNSGSSIPAISDQVLFDAAANLYESDSYIDMYLYISDEERQRLDNAYINMAVNSDAEQNDYDMAVKLLSCSLDNADDNSISAFVQKITDGADNETVGGNNYNRLLLDVALKYKEETNCSLMDVGVLEGNADICKSIVRTLAALHTTNDKTTNEQVAEILADNLYGAMKGSGTHEHVIAAILGKDGDNYIIHDSLLRDIEKAFIEQSHNGLTGGYDHTLYKYVNDQSSLGDNRDMYTSRMHYTNDKIGEYLEELGLTE